MYPTALPAVVPAEKAREMLYKGPEKVQSAPERCPNSAVMAAQGPCVVKAMPGTWPSCTAVEEENNTRNRRKMLGGSICHSA